MWNPNGDTGKVSEYVCWDPWRCHLEVARTGDGTRLPRGRAVSAKRGSRAWSKKFQHWGAWRKWGAGWEVWIIFNNSGNENYFFLITYIYNIIEQQRFWRYVVWLSHLIEKELENSEVTVCCLLASTACPVQLVWLQEEHWPQLVCKCRKKKVRKEKLKPLSGSPGALSYPSPGVQLSGYPCWGSLAWNWQLGMAIIHAICYIFLFSLPLSAWQDCSSQSPHGWV